jgi:hypothetical protein
MRLWFAAWGFLIFSVAMAVQFLSLFMTVFLGCASAKAQTLLVSDIDDTIKISHVLDLLSSIANADRTGNHFRGMSEVYQALLADNPGMTFTYVTNAPGWLMGSLHAQFLLQNHFPTGRLYLRDDSNDTGFKLRQIHQLIDQSQPTTVILLGDNGEQDPSVLAQIEKDYPEIHFYLYIHQLYSKSNANETGSALVADEVGFATSVDLIQEMAQVGLIKNDSVAAWIKQNVPGLLQEPKDEDEGELAFPDWMDCRDYKPSSLVGPTNNPLLIKYNRRLRHRCSISG